MKHAMCDPIKKILQSQPFMILDGGQATELERHGCDLDNSLWSAKILLENPEIIENVYSSYLNAGADCIGTMTYQATFPGFRAKGYTDSEIKNIFSDAVKIACGSRNDFWNKYNSSKSEYESRSDQINIGIAESETRTRPLVVGSIGCYGAYLADGSEYTGNYNISSDELYEFHISRIRCLLKPASKSVSPKNGKIENEGLSPDLLAFETIPSLSEARILADILKEFPGVFATLSFSLLNETSISEGENIGNAAKEFKDNGQISAIGVNCTKPEFILPIIKILNNATDKPIIVYPNSGEKYDAGTKTWSSEDNDSARRDEKSSLQEEGVLSPKGDIRANLENEIPGAPKIQKGLSTANVSTDFSKLAELWYNEGAKIIGGCCRTTPEDIQGIAAFRSELETLGK